MLIKDLWILLFLGFLFVFCYCYNNIIGIFYFIKLISFILLIIHISYFVRHITSNLMMMILRLKYIASILYFIITALYK